MHHPSEPRQWQPRRWRHRQWELHRARPLRSERRRRTLHPPLRHQAMSWPPYRQTRARPSRLHQSSTRPLRSRRSIDHQSWRHRHRRSEHPRWGSCPRRCHLTQRHHPKACGSVTRGQTPRHRGRSSPRYRGPQRPPRPPEPRHDDNPPRTWSEHSRTPVRRVGECGLPSRGFARIESPPLEDCGIVADHGPRRHRVPSRPLDAPARRAADRTPIAAGSRGPVPLAPPSLPPGFRASFGTYGAGLITSGTAGN